MQIPNNPFYDIDLHGVVRLISTNEIVPEYKNRFGKRAVKIRGKSHKPSSHPLDRLMLNTYKPLPEGKDSEWMSVLYLDDNKNNISICNLDWSEDWYTPDHIQGIEYGVTSWITAFGIPELQIRLIKPGEIGIRDSLTYNEIGGHYNLGYLVVNIPRSTKSIPYHRLIALNFLSHPVDTDHLTVNHKDSVKANNDIHNLEWATYTENNFHSFSCGPRSGTVRKIRLKNIVSDEEHVVAGYQEMARFLGVLPQAAHQAMERRKFEGRPYKGYVFKFEDDPRSWTELTCSGPRDDMSTSTKVAVKNMDNGNVVVYTSFAELLRTENIRSFIVHRLLNQNTIIPWRRRCFQKVYDDQLLKWPSYPKEIVDVYENLHASDKPIEVTDRTRNETKYYASVTNWCEEDRSNRCDPAVLSRYLKNNGMIPLEWRRWIFSYINLHKYRSE